MASGKQQTSDILTSVDKNGSANLLATQTLGAQTIASVERNAALVGQTIERTSNATGVSIERANTNLSNMIQSAAHEERGYNFQHHAQLLNSFKDTDLRVADSLRWNVENAGRLNLDMYKIKSDLEKQASDNHNMTTRDILGTKTDILRQNAENTMAIQMEALKNKDSLSKQMMECCCEIKEKIGETDKERVRDFLTEQRVENLILRNRSPPHHRGHYDVHDNYHYHRHRHSRDRSRSPERRT